MDDSTDRFTIQLQGVAPFPRARFLKFLSRLKVQSKDFGLVPFKLLGSQIYILDEIEEGLSKLGLSIEDVEREHL